MVSLNWVIWAKISYLIQYSSYEKAVFTITGSWNIQLLKFRLFNFSNFKTAFVKNVMKKFPGSKIYFESADKVLPPHQHLWSEFSRQWNNSPLIIFFFFFNLRARAFCFLNFVKHFYIKASIFSILLKCIVVGYSNRNERFTGKLFSNCGSLDMLFDFFWYLIHSVFHETFVEMFMKKHHFSAQISKTHFKT